MKLVLTHFPIDVVLTHLFILACLLLLVIGGILSGEGVLEIQEKYEGALELPHHRFIPPLLLHI